MPEAVFNIIAKDDQVEHIARQVHPSRMHEHGGEDGDEEGSWILSEVRRGERPGVHEFIPAGQFHEENQDIGSHQQPRLQPG